MIVASICARGGSKGVPRKNIKLLNGLPLIAYTIECARRSKRIDRVVLSTDDEEIAGIARSYGAEVPFLRPAELAQDTTSKWPVFMHLVQAYEAITLKKIDILVDLDIGTPLRSPQDIDDCIAALERSDTDIAITAYEPERNPYFNMVEQKGGSHYGVIIPSAQPVVRRQDAPKVYGLSPAVYAMRRESLFKYDHWASAPFTIHPIPRERAVDIDSAFDFKLIEFILQENEHREHPSAI